MARKLIVEIVGDSRSYERALNRSSAATTKFNADINKTTQASQGLRGALSTTGGAGGFLFGSGTFVAAALTTGAIVKATSAASDLNEQVSRTRVVMGNSADAMIAWSKTTASSMGISQRAALAAAGTFAGLFQTVGVSQQQATNLSQALVKLAADLASLQNSSPEEALIALRSGLAGEAEPLRRFNIFLTETRVQQQALAETGKKTTAALTQQEKTLARYSLIMKDSVLAQGNFELTSEGLANQQRVLKAETDDLAASAGQALVPAMTAAAAIAVELVGGINFLVDAVSGLHGLLEDTDAFDGWNQGVDDANTGIQGFFESIGDGIPFLEDAIAKVRELRGEVREAVGGPRIEVAAGPSIEPEGPRGPGAIAAAQSARAVADAAKIKAANEAIARATRRANATTNQQLAESERRAAHLRDLIRADPDNAKLQKRLTDELVKQAALREKLVSSAKVEAAAAESATKAVRDQLMATLDLAEAQAGLTKSLEDDLAAAKNREATLRRLVSLNRSDLDLANQLVSATQARRDIERQIAEARREQVKARQFKALGLSPEGLKPTPGSGSLLKRALGLQEQIKGTVLDTPKMQAQLRRIVNFLRKNFGKAGKDVRQAILQMLNDISGAFDKGETKKGPLTKTSGLNTRKLAEGLGLTPEQERELRQRASKFNTAGRRLASGGTNAPGAGGGAKLPSGGIFVESHTTIRLDGKVVANVVTRNQQKERRRNPRQKRGQHRN